MCAPLHITKAASQPCAAAFMHARRMCPAWFLPHNVQIGSCRRMCRKHILLQVDVVSGELWLGAKTWMGVHCIAFLLILFPCAAPQEEVKFIGAISSLMPEPEGAPSNPPTVTSPHALLQNLMLVRLQSIAALTQEVFLVYTS